MSRRDRDNVPERTNRRRGATMIEFAISFLLFLSCIAGAFEFSRAMWTSATLGHAAKETARFLATHGGLNPANATQIETIAKRNAVGLAKNDLVVSTVWHDPQTGAPRHMNPAIAARGEQVEVRLTYPFPWILTKIIGVNESSTSMTSSSRMIVMN